jgi:hypothetical protein
MKRGRGGACEGRPFRRPPDATARRSGSGPTPPRVLNESVRRGSTLPLVRSQPASP